VPAPAIAHDSRARATHGELGTWNLELGITGHAGPHIEPCELYSAISIAVASAGAGPESEDGSVRKAGVSAAREREPARPPLSAKPSYPLSANGSERNPLSPALSSALRLAGRNSGWDAGGRGSDNKAARKRSEPYRIEATDVLKVRQSLQ
jgi:hypothetical protein